MVIIISSREDDSGLYDKNRGYLKEGIEEGDIRSKGFDNYSPEGFVFNSKCTYDFTRSAKAKIREEMVTYLIDDEGSDDDRKDVRKDLRKAFGCLFEYQRYKENLNKVGQKQGESMEMFVFDDKSKKYVVHIKFSSTATRDAANQFTVHATLTCQRYTYFPLQQTDDEDDKDDFVTALQNLHVQ